MLGGPEDHGMIAGHRVRNNRELDALGQRYGAGCKRVSRKKLRQELDEFLEPAPDEGGPGDHMSEDMFDESIGEVEHALTWEAISTYRFRELRAKMGSCRPQLNKGRHARWRDAMTVLCEKGNRRYPNQVDFEDEVNDETR